jgi:hypothetical protein
MSSPDASGASPNSNVVEVMRYLDPLTRLGAIFLGVMYGAGFVIVTLHHAQFGVAELSLLKVRVLAAGVLFMVLTLLPVIAAARTYGMFGLGGPHIVEVRHKPEDRHLHEITIALGLYLSSFGLALATSILFDDEPSVPPRWAFFVILPAMFWFAPLIGRLFETHPRKCAALNALVMVGLGSVGTVAWGFSFLIRTLWFYACCLSTLLMRDSLRQPGFFKRVELERFVAVPLGLILLFSVFVYGTANPKFGGGAPVPVLLHVTPEAAKLLGGEAVSLWLIDQTDYGFYFLRRREDKKAILLPRSSIRAVEFNSAPQSNQQPSKK